MSTTSCDARTGPAVRVAVPDAVLALPDGWVIDPLARQRLDDQLSRSGAGCAGVVAPLRELSPGASYRTAAEHAALIPATAIAPAEERTVQGAVLLRRGVDFVVRGGVVEVDGGGLLTDPGAVVHDPFGGIGVLSSASTDGRPPFPYRPVVVFLGLDPDPALAERVRALVNDLVAGGTEGRIAVAEPTDGLHLTRPCAPTEASVRALAPDALVALDATALSLGSRWLGDDRSAVVVEMTRDTSDAVELVPWRIGAARGRLRARVGRGVSAEAVGALVRRLCAGPQPLPPRVRNPQVHTIRRPSKTPNRAVGALDPAPQAVALLGPDVASARERFDGVADHLDAIGGGLAVHHIDDQLPDGARHSPLVIMRSAPASGDLRALIRDRRRAGRPTVIDIARSDVSHIGDAGRGFTLDDDASSLLELAGHATTTSRRMRDWLLECSVRAFVLPTLRTRRRVETLRDRRVKGNGGDLVLGWDTGAPAPTREPARVAVAAAIDQLLDAHRDLRVELVGHDTELAVLLRDRARVVAAPGEPAASTIAKWTVHCRTPLAADTVLPGDLTSAVDAAFLGVPTVAVADDPVVRDGLVPAALAVSVSADPSAWRDLLDPLVTRGDAWSTRSAEVAQLAEALYGPETSIAVLNRLFGWLGYEGES